ncbi:AAA family ATPase, partial [Tenacibaculum finnmarkense]
MPKNQKKYIITGAPGTGKTTLINLLKNSFSCMDEVSRKVITEEQ